MKNTNNGTIEFANVEEMVNFANNPKLVTMTTVKQALTIANVEFKPNEARAKYCEYMQASGMWTVAPTNEPIQTEEKENEPMNNMHNEVAEIDANLTDTPANVAPIDTNSDVPIVQVAQSDELDEVLGSAPIDTNVPANENAPMSKSEALEFLKEYEAHTNAYANAYLKAGETFETLLSIGATEEKHRQLTVSGLVKASGILATNVDAYLAEKFAGKKIGKVEYAGIDTVTLARQIAESEFERMNRSITNFKFSMQEELTKLCAMLVTELPSHFGDKMPIDNVSIAVKGGTIHFVNPIAPPATKRANKTATTNEGEAKKRASYKVKDNLSYTKKGKDWEIHITTSGDTFCFACHKEGQPDAMITGEFSNRDGISFPEACNKAYQNVTSDKSRVSVLAWLPSSCFIFEETTN